MRYYERERREFVRVNAEVAVRYRFLGHDATFQATGFVDGKTSNLSGGGMLLTASVADPDWIPGLLTEHIFIGVEIDLPGADGPVRALARAAWVEAAGDGSGTCRIGLRFKEITRQDQDRLFNFVIGNQLA